MGPIPKLCAAFAVWHSAKIITQQGNFNVAIDGSSRTSKAITSDNVTASLDVCSTTEGSLHSIALDMFRHSSPPRSLSLAKFQRILDQNPSFHVNFPRKIFQSNQVSMSKMLQGYGLVPETNWASNVTLVETLLHSVCPIERPDCVNRTRIIIQTEQTIKNKLGACHNAPNCIILEFSDYNFRTIQEKGWGDSTVLLPIMHQSPSRLWVDGSSPTTRLKPLIHRSTDVTFFGLMTKRRRILKHMAQAYLDQHPNRSMILKQVGALKTQIMAQAYADSKVCLVSHSYRAKSGGEYHRLSELAPFGCIPVMETLQDTIGIGRYSKCGKVVFSNFDDLFPTIERVLSSIDDDSGQDFSHVTWWNAGVQWETLLSTVMRGH